MGIDGVSASGGQGILRPKVRSSMLKPRSTPLPRRHPRPRWISESQALTPEMRRALDEAYEASKREKALAALAAYKASMPLKVRLRPSGDENSPIRLEISHRKGNAAERSEASPMAEGDSIGTALLHEHSDNQPLTMQAIPPVNAEPGVVARSQAELHPNKVLKSGHDRKTYSAIAATALVIATIGTVAIAVEILTATNNRSAPVSWTL